MHQTQPLIVLGLFMLHGTAAAQPSPKFVDVTADLKLAHANVAACWADFDGDGRPDLCAGDVWMNRGVSGFEKTTDVPGSCVAADFDNDGRVDLFSWSALKLFRNTPQQRFEEIPLPDLPPSVSRGACWGDFNGDGFVDLFVGGYEDWDRGITFPLLLLINEQGRSFRLAREEVRHRARGVTACDFDEDGDLDVYSSNYRLQPNDLWINDGTGSFEDQAKRFNAVATSEGFAGGHSIGSAWGDFDNDGRFDLFAGNFAHQDGRGNQPQSRFLRNLGPREDFVFADLGTCGVHYQESYATPAVADFDNDGHLDLYFTTVYDVASFGRPNHPVLFRGDGKFTMTDVTEEVGLPPLPPTDQAAWADYDLDGDLDLVTAGRLFENRGAEGHWIAIRLAGDGDVVNRSAIGAQVRIVAGDASHVRQVEAGTGEGNQNDLSLHFGLGSHSEAVTAHIIWPNGTTQTIAGLVVGRYHDISFQP